MVICGAKIRQSTRKTFWSKATFEINDDSGILIQIPSSGEEMMVHGWRVVSRMEDVRIR